MKFAPGSKFHYNNAGFIILGLIIEEQTDRT
ncbi:serine hydrolase [Bacillus wiedmannii]|nr:beta-lactamase family protein [Bacillus wiedmannii]MCR6847289.1 beta-lactamase family protein [Bacillus sp. IBL03825]MCX3313581.1 serine hydrolase [Bacillus wiedmannii]MED3080170.1 serine hydrolase [Bacillus wiedmannii]